MGKKKATPDVNKKITPNVRLRKAREQLNLKQSELAEKIGVTPVTVSRWENGSSIPTPYYRRKLCEFFQMNAEALSFNPSGESEIALPQGTPPAIWNVPYRQNVLFTGREDILARLREALTAERTTALTQPQAMSGLGGVGKTQIALEYAYRYRHEYHTIFWVRANSPEALTSDFAAIATLLNLPEQNVPEQNRAVDAVKRWLASMTRWLLILDNADDLHLASQFIPSPCQGHVLLTTRTRVTGTIAHSMEIDTMKLEEGMLFLLRRAKLLDMNASLDQVSELYYRQAATICQILDGLPLAINQAGAYIEETGCSLSNYLQLYQTHRRDLLLWRGELTTDYPHTVATTWSLSFGKVEQANSAAADLLRLCAFLAPDVIPEEVLTEGAPELGPILQSVAADLFQLDRAIKELLKYSLLRRNPDSRTLTTHRLVQAVLKDSMDEFTQYLWVERAIRAVNRVFPAVQFSTWECCQRSLPQAEACAALVTQYQLAFPEAARLLDLAGYYLHERGRYDEADLLLHQALTMREKVLGPEHPDTATSLNNLALLYHAQGKYGQAESLFQGALTMREKVLGPEHPDTATSLNNLAQLYQAQGKYEQAEPLYQQALAVREKVLGPEHPDTAISLNDLAVLYADQGKYEQAEILSQRALEIKEKVLGSEHPDIAVSLANLAGFYHTEGKYKQAEVFYQRALAIFDRVLGPEYSDTAIVLDNLAGLYTDQGKYKQAELLSHRALEIREKVLGMEHPNVSQSLVTLAGLYHVQGKYKQAELLYQRSLAIYEKALGPQHAYTAGSLTYLAILYTDQGKYEQAEPLSRRALTIKEQVLGPEHPSTATSLNNLAMLCQVQGRYEQAELLYQGALSIREKVLGLEHPDTAATLDHLARFYQIQGQCEQAESLCRRALAIREKVLGPEHPDTATSLNTLASLYAQQGKQQEAEQLCRRSHAILERIFGSEHPQLAQTYSILASVYAHAGKYQEAEQLHQRALAIRQQLLGPEHPEVAKYLDSYTSLLRQLGRTSETVKPWNHI